MGHVYDNWLAREKSWITEAEMKIKKSMSRYAVLEIAGCTGGFAAIGFLSGAGLWGAMMNLGIGFIFGAVAALITVLAIRASLPASKYMQRLKETVEKALSAVEREEFASQMLDESAKCVSWFNVEEKIEYRIHITTDYLLHTSGRGGVNLVPLRQVERIELDTTESIQKVRGGGMTVSVRETDYPMFFYYLNSGREKNKKADNVIYFPSKALRDQAANCLENIDRRK